MKNLCVCVSVCQSLCWEQGFGLVHAHMAARGQPAHGIEDLHTMLATHNEGNFYQFVRAATLCRAGGLDRMQSPAAAAAAQVSYVSASRRQAELTLAQGSCSVRTVAPAIGQTRAQAATAAEFTVPGGPDDGRTWPPLGQPTSFILLSLSQSK